MGLDFSIIHVLPPPSDHFHFRLEPHPEARLHHLLRMGDEGADVSRGSSAGVHEIVRVHRRDLGPADAVSLEPGGLDELARGSGPALLLPARARRVLEYAAAARLVERRPPLPPLEHLGDLLLEPVLLLRAEAHRRLHDDASGETAAAVVERDLAPREHMVAPRGI